MTTKPPYEPVAEAPTVRLGPCGNCGSGLDHKTPGADGRDPASYSCKGPGRAWR